jgi:hypothetical protein
MGAPEAEPAPRKENPDLAASAVTAPEVVWAQNIKSVVEPTVSVSVEAVPVPDATPPLPSKANCPPENSKQNMPRKDTEPEGVPMQVVPAVPGHTHPLK